MRFAEVFLRLGLSLVGWMVVYAYVVWLAAARAVGCGPDGSEMYALLLGFAPLATAFAFALRMTRPFGEIQRMLRWLGAPLALLLLPAILSVWDVFRLVQLNGQSICSASAPPAWQQFWAPVQLAALAATILVIGSIWRATLKARGTEQES